MAKKENEQKNKELRQKVAQIEDEKQKLEKKLEQKSKECQQLIEEKEQTERSLAVIEKEEQDFLAIKAEREQEKRESTLLQRKVFQLFEELKHKVIELETNNQQAHQTLVDMELKNNQLKQELTSTEEQCEKLQTSYNRLNDTKVMKWTRQYWALRNGKGKGK